MKRCSPDKVLHRTIDDLDNLFRRLLVAFGDDARESFETEVFVARVAGFYESVGIEHQHITGFQLEFEFLVL